MLGALLACLALVAAGCAFTCPTRGPTIQAAPDTEYYFLMGPFGFQATDFGLAPEVQAYGGGPWWMPLEECRIKAEGLKGWPEAYVTARREGGRLAEVGLWYGGVICRRFDFRYDTSGRLAARVDTQYEARRKGEFVNDWVKRMAGTTPKVTCVREVGYSWSADGRMATVKILGVSESPDWGGLSEWPSIRYGTPGQIMETWQLDADGHIVGVFYDGDVAYSATYDDAGRLLRATGNDGDIDNQYDAQGRLVETTVKTSSGYSTVFAHGYPDARPPKLPATGDAYEPHTYVLTHDGSGHIVRVKADEKSGDVLGRYTVHLKRDGEGRVRRLKIHLSDLLLDLFQGQYVFE